MRVVVGDITRLDEQGEHPDAVVNAANTRLAAGSGVCGAIFAAAGPSELARACAAVGGCSTGAAVATPSFALAEHGIGHIIHAVGPVYAGQDPESSDELLAATYRSVLAVAAELGVRCLAVPAISTGVYGFPPDRVAAVAVGAISSSPVGIEQVLLVAYDEAAAGVLREAVAALPAEGLA